MRRTVPRRGADAGQIATALMIIVTIALTTVVTFGVLGIGGAVDERSQAQTAADAAALGGLEAARTDLAATLLVGLASPLDLWRPGCQGSGQIGAADFAVRNRAVLTQYCWEPAQDRVTVKVRNQETNKQSGGPAVASATARLGIGPTRCEWVPLPLVVPPDPIMLSAVALRCTGGLDLEFGVLSTGALMLITPAPIMRQQLEDSLEPALTR